MEFFFAVRVILLSDLRLSLMHFGELVIHGSQRAIRALMSGAVAAVCALVIAGCGSDEPKSELPADPAEAIRQAFRNTKTVKTGKQQGSVVLRLSGPVDYEITVEFEGPFDLTDLARPEYSYDAAFRSSRRPPRKFGLAASGDTRFVTVEGESFSAHRRAGTGTRSPLGVLAREIAGQVQNPVKMPGEVGRDGDLELYRGSLSPAVFRGRLVPIFNDLVQPGMRSTAIGGSRTESVFQRAIQEASVTLGISHDGLLKVVRLRTNGRLAERSAIEAIRLDIDVAVTDQNEPVQVEVPRQAVMLKSEAALEQRLSAFIAQQSKGLTLPNRPAR